MGFDPVYEISAEHGHNVGELLDAIADKLPSRGPEPDEPDEPDEPVEPVEPVEPEKEVAIAIVGRPNAGKSSLVNRLLREERMIVSEVPGTTRDSVDSLLMWHRRPFRIVDTAGIRRPGKVSKSGQVESVSVLLAKRAIERADVVVLVIDATLGPTDQDGAIAGAAQEAGRGIIIAANKWDLMKEQGPDAAKKFDENLRYQLKFLDFAPILHISAVTGERTPKLLEVVDKVSTAGRARVGTGELNRFIEKITTSAPPVTAGHRNVRVMYASQTSVAPPTFVLFTNTVTKLHFSYERFLQNRLREAYGFFGNPIRIQMRGRTDERGERRRTAGERAPDRQSPVKKGPGSPPTKRAREKAAYKAARKAGFKPPSKSWDKPTTGGRPEPAARRGDKPLGLSRTKTPKKARKAEKRRPKRAGRR